MILRLRCEGILARALIDRPRQATPTGGQKLYAFL